MSDKMLKYILMVLLIGGSLGCQPKTPEQGMGTEVVQPEMQTLVAQKVQSDDFFSLSLNSLLQGNDKGLLVTPGQSALNGNLFLIPKVDNLTCCPEAEPIIGVGRGPGEMQHITASSESYNSDTLLFYSAPDRKLMVFDNDMETIAFPEQIHTILPMNRGFTYSDGFLFIPVEPQLTGGNYLAMLYDVRNQNQIDALPLRVPAGHEPAIRNMIFASVSLPGGFAVSFLGDRQIYFLNHEGEVTERLILGKSDPIGKPYKIANPNLAPSSRPYIPKMEYQNGKLFVLMDAILWIIDYPLLEPELRLQILDDVNTEEPRVVDFTVTEEMLYLRLAPNDIYKTPVRPDWLQ